MRPAASLILFTTLSGAGFGLLAALGIGLGPTTGWPGLLLFGLGFALAAAGLAASSFHLGRPERALKAFREWRTSWLSREAWLSAGTLGLMALFALLRLFGAGPAAFALGVPAALLAAATVTATAMIYASLATVPRWHHWSTPAIFLGHAASAGALLTGHHLPAMVLIGATGLGLFAAWRAGDRRRGPSTGEATGLGPGTRPFEPPHTGPSYLTREMVFVVARRHATKLRSIALAVGYIAPLMLLPVPYTLPLAALAHLAGAMVARWLFFAEAEHVLASYYRARGSA